MLANYKNRYRGRLAVGVGPIPVLLVLCSSARNLHRLSKIQVGDCNTRLRYPPCKLSLAQGVYTPSLIFALRFESKKSSALAFLPTLLFAEWSIHWHGFPHKAGPSSHRARAKSPLFDGTPSPSPQSDRDLETAKLITCLGEVPSQVLGVEYLQSPAHHPRTCLLAGTKAGLSGMLL